MGNGTLARVSTPLPTHIAISEDRQLFSELSADELGECIAPTPTLCRVVTALSHRLSKRTCSMAIFNAEKKLVASDCQVINLARPFN